MLRKNPEITAIYDSAVDALFIDFGPKPMGRVHTKELVTTPTQEHEAVVDYVPVTDRVVSLDLMNASRNLSEAFLIHDRVTLKPDFLFSRKLTSMKASAVPSFDSAAEAARFCLIDTLSQPTNNE